MKLGSSLLQKILPLRKGDCEVVATIMDYNHEKKEIVATANGTSAVIALEDMTIYLRDCIKGNHLDRDYFNRILGQTLKCFVISEEANKVTLSRAKIMEENIRRFKVNDKVKAKVIKVSENGVTLEFGEGLRGFMFTSKLKSTNKGLYTIGETVDCIITKVPDQDSLDTYFRLKQAEAKNYQINDEVYATVVSGSANALYLKLDGNASATMYLSDLTSSKVVNTLDIYPEGSKIRCIVKDKRTNNNGTYYVLSRLGLYPEDFNIELDKRIDCRITKKLTDGSGYFVEVLDNPHYSGIFDLNEYNKGYKYKVGNTIKLRVAKDKGKKQLSFRTN